jgi:hypothetical protein
MDVKDMAKDPVVRDIMKDTDTQIKMEKWAHALMAACMPRTSRSTTARGGLVLCSLMSGGK